MLKTLALCLFKRLLRGLNLELDNKKILVYNTVEPRFNAVAGDQRRIRYIEARYVEVLFHTLYCNFGRDVKYRSLYRELR